MTDDEDDLSWASSLTGEALDALGGVDQFQEALGSGGHDVREAVQAAGGAILLSEALASIAEALDSDDGRVAVNEALDAAGARNWWPKRWTPPVASTLSPRPSAPQEGRTPCTKR